MKRGILIAVVLMAAALAGGAAQAGRGHGGFHGGHGHGWHGGHFGHGHGHGWHGGHFGHGHGHGWHGGHFGHGHFGSRWNFNVGWGGYYPRYSNYNYGYWPRYSSGYWPSYGYYPRSYIYSQPYYPAYYPTYNYYPAYNYGCGYYGYSQPALTVPPAALYVRADAAYGPDAVKEFMGVDRDFAKGPLAPARPLIVNVAPADPAARVVAAPKREAAREPVASNAEARVRAARLVALGDAQFGGQQFHSAAQRYRLAAEAAPDLADAYFRQAFAYIASNRRDQAVAALRRGLAIDPLWVNSSFRIDELYDGAGLAKHSHIDTLASGALTDRGNADYYFLLGLLLHFDGQQERARKFFEQAEKLTGDGDKAHIQVFLNPPAPAAKDAV